MALAAAAAAKSLQSCPTLCNPVDDSPPGSAVPGCRGQPQQDPGGTLRMNSVGERERRHMRLALIGPSLRERERERETRWGVQSLAESGNALFFTIAFIP